MSADFISTNNEIIDRNGFLIPSIAQQYSMSFLQIAGTLRPRMSPNSRSGFGSASIKNLTAVKQGKAIPSTISSLTNVFNTVKAKQKTHVFDLEPLVLRYDVPEINDAISQDNIISEVIKDMMVGLDISTVPTLFDNLSNYSFLETTAGIDIAKINSVVTQAFQSLKNNLKISVGGNLTIYVDDVVDAYLQTPTAEQVTTLEEAFLRALRGNSYDKFDNEVASAIKAKLTLNANTVNEADGLILVAFSPNIACDHGFLPQLYKTKDTDDLQLAHYFATNNAGFEVFKQSVVAIRVVA